MLSLSTLFGDEASIFLDKNFQVLASAAVIPVLGISLMSPILDSLIEPFGVTSANIGLMISAFTAPAIVMIPVAGVLADRYGRKPVLISSILLFGVSGTAIAFTTDFRIVLALRLLQGIGFAGTNPIIITSIGDLYTQEAEATGQGIRFMISGLSGAVFPLVASLLILLAWQFPFLLYAVSLPVAIGVYLRFDEPTDSTGSVATEGGDSASYLRSLFRLAIQPRVLSILIARALFVTVWIGFVTYNSLIVVRLMDGTPVEAGILATVGFLTFALAGSQAGRITSLLESRLTLLLGANVCLGVGFIVILFAPTVGVGVIGVAMAAMGFGILGSLYRSIITSLAPTDLRAGLVSLAEAGGRVGVTATPFAMGGVVALASPTMGFGTALQLAGVGLAIVGCGGSIVCLLVANTSPAVQVD